MSFFQAFTMTGKTHGGAAEGSGGSRRRALSAPHSAPVTECSIWENGVILPGATREFARAEGIRFPDALISNLKAARVGPARASLCAMRQAEARDALREAEATLGEAEEAIDKGEGFAALVLGLRETHWLCSGLGHALEILEANSRACGEGAQVMAEYQPLIIQAGNCEWRLTRLAERWRETEGKEFSFGKFMSLVTTPFAAVFQNLLPNVGLVSESHGRRRTYEDEGCSSGRPPSEGDADAGAGGADAGAGGSSCRRSALGGSAALDSATGDWTFWGDGPWGNSGGSTSSYAECSVEETVADRAPAEKTPRAKSASTTQIAREEQAQTSSPSRMSELEADLLKLKMDMERKAMQAEDSAARSREVHEAMARQLLAAKGSQGPHHGGQEADMTEKREEFFDGEEDEFFDPGDE